MSCSVMGALHMGILQLKLLAERQRRQNGTVAARVHSCETLVTQMEEIPIEEIPIGAQSCAGAHGPAAAAWEAIGTLDIPC